LLAPSVNQLSLLFFFFFDLFHRPNRDHGYRTWSRRPQEDDGQETQAWPHAWNALLRTKRGDITIYSVLQKSESVRLLDGAILDTAFSRIFEEATKLQQEASGSEQFAHQPIDFIRALQLRTVSNPPSSCLAFRWFPRGRSSDFVTSLFQRSDLARSN
jgi:hypothetical protein